jgi:hypothetical protein
MLFHDLALLAGEDIAILPLEATWGNFTPCSALKVGNTDVVYWHRGGKNTSAITPHYYA